MAEAITTAPLSIALEIHEQRPSLAVRGQADDSNIHRVLDALDRLAHQHEHCVSLDLAGLQSMDVAAASRLAGTAGVLKSQGKRVRIKRASPPVRDVMDRMVLADAFCCEEECSYELCPARCGIASADWEIDVFTLPSAMSCCQEARVRVDRIAEAVGFSSCNRKDILLAVGEAVSNAVRHGSGSDSFTVSCVATSSRLCVSVSDSGPGFDPDALPSLEEALFAEHGRGVHCMRALMDEVSYSFSGGTTVRMVKIAP